MADKIVINNYTGSPPGMLEEIPMGHEVLRWTPMNDHQNWWFGFPDGSGESLDLKEGKTYILYEQDAEG